MFDCDGRLLLWVKEKVLILLKNFNSKFKNQDAIKIN